MVELLARTLTQRGRKVAILTRGYKSADLDKPQEWKDKDGRPARKTCPRSPATGKRATWAPCIPETNPSCLPRTWTAWRFWWTRTASSPASSPLNTWGADTLLLDDGMQYLKLAHELDIVLVDCGAPFGHRGHAPARTLREPRGSLARASYIVLTKCGGQAPG